MVDNISITEGAGKLVATDEIDGVNFQRIKLNIGPDGSAEDLVYGARPMDHSISMAIATNDPLQTRIGAVDEIMPVNDNDNAGMNGRLQRIAARLTTLIGLIPSSLGMKTSAASLAVTLSSDDQGIGTKTTAVTALGTGGVGILGWLSQIWQQLNTGTMIVNQATQGYNVLNTITRPANVTPYTALDVVGGPLTFATIGPNAGTISITGAQLELDIAALPAGMTNFQLHFHSVTPPSAVADNGAWTLPAGDRASYLGFIDLGTPVLRGTILYVETNNINKHVKLTSTSIFAYIVSVTGYTPAANSEVYKVTLHTRNI